MNFARCSHIYSGCQYEMERGSDNLPTATRTGGDALRLAGAKGEQPVPLLPTSVTLVHAGKHVPDWPDGRRKKGCRERRHAVTRKRSLTLSPSAKNYGTTAQFVFLQVTLFSITTL